MLFAILSHKLSDMLSDTHSDILSDMISVSLSDTFVLKIWLWRSVTYSLTSFLAHGILDMLSLEAIANNTRNLASNFHHQSAVQNLVHLQ